MKFIHVGDLHLGACPETERGWGEERKKDIEQSLSESLRWPMKNRQTSVSVWGYLSQKTILEGFKQAGFFFVPAGMYQSFYDCGKS